MLPNLLVLRQITTDFLSCQMNLFVKASRHLSVRAVLKCPTAIRGHELTHHVSDIKTSD